jgi:hypothetical protein
LYKNTGYESGNRLPTWEKAMKTKLKNSKEEILTRRKLDSEVDAIRDFDEIGIGWRGERLVLFEKAGRGFALRPISILKSIEWMADNTLKNVADGFTNSPDAEVKWFNAIARAMPR